MSERDGRGERSRRRAAAALAYDPGEDRAPRLVARGRGLVAERIVALARAADVPVAADAALAEALVRVDLLREVPEELYLAVAEVIAFLYRMAEPGRLERRG
jgi:flagellar biosynthesis protein